MQRTESCETALLQSDEDMARLYLSHRREYGKDREVKDRPLEPLHVAAQTTYRSIVSECRYR